MRILRLRVHVFAETTAWYNLLQRTKNLRIFRRIIRFSMRLHTVTEELSAVLLKTVMTST